MSTQRHHDQPARRYAMSARLALAAALLALTTGCHPPTATGGTATSGAAGGTATALEVLDALPVRPEDTGAHYDRDTWGDWTTRRGCTTREQILIRDGDPVVRDTGCRVAAGTWTSPYDGLRVTDPAGVQVDHRVPVREALRSGARDWTRQERARFYNDPANLAAVSAHANTSKGDGDPGRWRPPDQRAWCGYAVAYLTTKHTYHLSVDQAEHDGLAAMLATCRS